MRPRHRRHALFPVHVDRPGAGDLLYRHPRPADDHLRAQRPPASPARPSTLSSTATQAAEGVCRLRPPAGSDERQRRDRIDLEVSPTGAGNYTVSVTATGAGRRLHQSLLIAIAAAGGSVNVNASPGNRILNLSSRDELDRQADPVRRLRRRPARARRRSSCGRSGRDSRLSTFPATWGRRSSSSSRPRTR